MKLNFETIVIMIITTLNAAGAEKAIEILQDFHDRDSDLYNSAIWAGVWGLKKIRAGITDGTETKIDDSLVDSVDGIIRKSAQQNGITI